MYIWLVMVYSETVVQLLPPPPSTSCPSVLRQAASVWFLNCRKQNQKIKASSRHEHIRWSGNSNTDLVLLNPPKTSSTRSQRNGLWEYVKIKWFRIKCVSTERDIQKIRTDTAKWCVVWWCACSGLRTRLVSAFLVGFTDNNQKKKTPTEYR